MHCDGLLLEWLAHERFWIDPRGRVLHAVILNEMAGAGAAAGCLESGVWFLLAIVPGCNAAAGAGFVGK